MLNKNKQITRTSPIKYHPERIDTKSLNNDSVRPVGKQIQGALEMFKDMIWE